MRVTRFVILTLTLIQFSVEAIAESAITNRANEVLEAARTNRASELAEQLNQQQAKTDEELISISLDDVPLNDVVRMFSRISGANIIAPDELLEAHRVTIHLEDVKWQIALRAIFDQAGFSMVKEHQGIYRVISKPASARMEWIYVLGGAVFLVVFTWLVVYRPT